MSYPVGLQGIGAGPSQDDITDALMRRTFGGMAGVGETYVGGVGALSIPVNGVIGAVSIPVNGVVGADDLAGLTPDEITLLSEVIEATAAGVGAAVPSLMNRFNAALYKPKFAQASVNRGLVKPAQQPAGLPRIPVTLGGNMQSAATPTIIGLAISGPTDLPILSLVPVPAGLTAPLQIRTNFPIRGTAFVFSENTRAAFSIINPSIGGVNVFANTQEVESDIYTPDATHRTLFPTLDTAQTLDMTVRNRSGAPQPFNGVLKGEAARPK